MRSIAKAAGVTLLTLLSAAPAFGTQQALTPNEAACEKSRYEFCANGLYARAPNSARTTSAMCLPGDQAGTPEIFALLNQNGSTPETILEAEVADPLKRERNPATALTSTLNFGRDLAQSDPFVGSSSEKALYVTSTLLGPNPLDLASNVTNGVSGATLGNAALSTLRTTCTTKYGAEDFTVRDAFKDTLRFVACDGGACAGDGDYLTSPAIWRDQQTSNWGYTFNVRVEGGNVGKVSGALVAPVDGSGRIQPGSISVTGHTLPNGTRGEVKACRASSDGHTLDDCVTISTAGPTSAAVDWADLLGSTVCTPSDTQACLNDGRFRVEATGHDFSGNTYEGRVVSLSEDSAYIWFFNPQNPEIFIKVLDACAHPSQNYWVFDTHLSNVEFTIEVTDTLTGHQRIINNPSGYTPPAVLSTSTNFRCDGTGEDLVVINTNELPPPVTPQIQEYVDPSVIGPCFEDLYTMCLNDNRFRVHATKSDFSGNTGPAKMWRLTNDGGYSTFFADSNVELFMKVLDACAHPSQNYWVFTGGLTNVPVELYIEDTTNGRVYKQTSPSGQTFATNLDTSTIFTCNSTQSNSALPSELSAAGLFPLEAPMYGGER